jgi:hypothetical protein
MSMIGVVGTRLGVRLVLARFSMRTMAATVNTEPKRIAAVMLVSDIKVLNSLFYLI